MEYRDADRSNERCGVRRIVRVSIANPSAHSPLSYYRGKSHLEQAVIDSGLSCTILPSTVIFGLEDILINNIGWFVRRFPVFGYQEMAGIGFVRYMSRTWRR